MGHIKETLADVQHEIWSHWMKYMFTQGTMQLDGSFRLPKEKVERWTRQMNTPYSELTEKEKKSDRHQADKVLSAIG